MSALLILYVVAAIAILFFGMSLASMVRQGYRGVLLIALFWPFVIAVGVPVVIGYGVWQAVKQ